MKSGQKTALRKVAGSGVKKSTSKKKVNKVTSEELKTLQSLNGRFHQAKVALGDLELRKQDVLKGIEDIKMEFNLEEKKLISKYGASSVVNLQTGELTEKETAASE